MQFLSTPSARRATRRRRRMEPDREISIHALREEGDQRIQNKALDANAISIHALREEGDHHVQVTSILSKSFLSTPSARRATAQTPAWKKFFAISIHALREEGDPPSVPHFGIEWYISIHALREEGDMSGNRSDTGHPVFLSTPSARRATGYRCVKHNADPFLSTPSARRATYLHFCGKVV